MSTAVEKQTDINGGEWLIRESDAGGSFIPEDFQEEALRSNYFGSNKSLREKITQRMYYLLFRSTHHIKSSITSDPNHRIRLRLTVMSTNKEALHLMVVQDGCVTA